MQLTIVARKEVESEEAGMIIFEMVKEHLSQYPHVKVTASCSTNLEITEPPG